MKHVNAMLGASSHCSLSGVMPGTSGGIQTILMRVEQIVSFSTYPIRNEHSSATLESFSTICREINLIGW